MKGAAARKVEQGAQEREEYLGDAWNSEDDLDAHEGELDEGAGLFFGFATAAFVIVSLALFLALYLISPRLAEFHPAIPAGLACFAAGIVSLAALALLIAFTTVKTGKNLFPPIFARGGRDKGLILVVIPLAVKLGRLIGVSRDRIASSFIKVNNAIVLAAQRKRDAKSVLLLLPRCIQHSKCNQKVEIDINNCKECGLCDIADIIKICEDNSVETFVATGGNIARKLIMQNRPSGVIGVACERELLSGIHDTSGLPVYGVPNLRPEGPCKDTRVDLAKIEEAVKAFK